MKQHYCFLERFNNYFNRKIIKYDSLLEYQNNSKSFFIPEDTHGAMMPFDFNPNDNVMTEIIANEVPFDPDYFLLLDDDSNIVQRWFVLEQKRNRQGQWLYQLRRDVVSDNLDNLSQAPVFVQKGMLQEDDPFIVNPEGMSFNQIKKSETLLKDKTQCAWVVGYMAKDAVSTDISVQVPTNVISNYVTLSDIALAIGTTESILATNFINGIGYFTNSINIRWKEECAYWLRGVILVTTSLNVANRTGSYSYVDTSDASYFLIHANQRLDYAVQPLARFRDSVVNYQDSLYLDMPSIMNRSYFLSSSQLTELQNFDGQIILYLGKYYRISVTINGTVNSSGDSNFSYKKYSSIQTICENTSLSNAWLNTTNGQIVDVSASETSVSLNLIELTDSDIVDYIEVQISTSRNQCAKQEFDMFCIPAGNINVRKELDSESPSYDTIDVAQTIASAIALENDAKVYDVQLLPYCPIYDDMYKPDSQDEKRIGLNQLNEHQDYDIVSGPVDYDVYVNQGFDHGFSRDGDDPELCHVDLTEYNNGEFQIDGLLTLKNNSAELTINQWNVTDVNVTYSVDYSTNLITITDITFRYPVLSDLDEAFFSLSFKVHVTKAPISFVFYCKKASFNGDIAVNLISAEGQKIESNCNFYRIVSPNYQGSFEFNLAKNGGSCSTMRYYCTYKPYTPFIKVVPELNYLYGNDYNDNRGLICAGDFSLPRITGAWESYQLQNKNYQNIFNREIQNLDFMQSIEMRNQLVSGGVGIFTDTAKGAGAGAYVSGSGWGALVGGALGATASAIGYGIDVDTLARTQRETKQLAIDKFNYQLGNVKALPYTLTKVGAFDISSKIFPFLEYYSCTDKEKEALINKIKYESMTVMRIGTLGEFIGFNNELNYFKGELIRNDEIADDSHVLNAIYEELLKGVYI